MAPGGWLTSHKLDVVMFAEDFLYLHLWLGEELTQFDGFMFQMGWFNHQLLVVKY